MFFRAELSSSNDKEKYIQLSVSEELRKAGISLELLQSEEEVSVLLHSIYSLTISITEN